MPKMYNRNYFTAAAVKISLGLLFLFDFKTSDIYYLKEIMVLLNISYSNKIKIFQI